MPTFEQFQLPDVGEGLTEAEIVQWHVAVGDEVRVNQVIVEIETAKSLVELPCPVAGVVAQVLVEEGRTVDVGTPIVVVDTDPAGAGPGAGSGGGSPGSGAEGGSAQGSGAEGGSAQGSGAEDGRSGAVLVGYGTAEHAAPAVRRRRRTAAPATSAPVAPTPAPTSAPPATSAPAAPPAPAAPAPAEPVGRVPARPASSDGPTPPGVAVLAKPPVRKLARDLGIELASLVGSGPGGIITREDVRARAAEVEPRRLATYPDDDRPWLASGVVSPDGRRTRVPVRSVRKRTAEAMVASAFTAPHVTVFQTVDVTRTMRLVAALREDREFADVRVTPLLIAAKALLIAVHRHPEINASWDEPAQEIVFKHYVNLGIAATTPRGLVVPNIKDAHRARLPELAVEIADLTTTARAGRTSPQAMADGTITITNVGVFGIDTGTPILNPGEAAILAFGAIREQPWVHKGKIRKRWVTQLALSFDHRLVDGELGARFLADVARVLEDPARAIVWG